MVCTGEQVSQILVLARLVSVGINPPLAPLFRIVLDAVDRAVDRVGLHQSRINEEFSEGRG
jgi:hypothetical protein